MLAFSWQQTSCNFDLQLDKTTKPKQMANRKLTFRIQTQENIEGIFVTLWQQQQHSPNEEKYRYLFAEYLSFISHQLFKKVTKKKSQNQRTHKPKKIFPNPNNFYC